MRVRRVDQIRSLALSTVVLIFSFRSFQIRGVGVIIIPGDTMQGGTIQDHPVIPDKTPEYS